MSKPLSLDRATLLYEIGITPRWVWRESARTSAATAASSDGAGPETPPAGADPPAFAGRPAESENIDAMSWGELEAAIRTCHRCGLAKARRQAVPGVGDRTPNWFVVGEGPGEQEDARGEPFVGPAGRLLDAMLAAVGRRRGEGVYITNVVKCRPPGNRNPEPEEIAACAPFLRRQLALAKPSLVLAVGKFAGQTLLGREETVAALRAGGGQCVLSAEPVPVVVTYHPSYLLRTPTEKARAWDDLQRAVALSARGDAHEKP